MTRTESTSAVRGSAATPEVGAVDAVRLAEALARLTRATRRQLHLPLGVSALNAMATVVDQGPMRLGDLALNEGVTPATLSRIVSALEQGGYARRTPDPADRRSAFLEITDAGRDTLAEVRHARTELMRARVERLGAEERRALAAALPALEALAEG
jgi:DNA-binding MarR family transcriptional regulator